MPSENGSIKYSDLIIPDDSINNLIGQLEKLGGTFDKMTTDIQAKAKTLSQALNGLSGATASGQEGIRKISEEAEALGREQKAIKEMVATINEQIKAYKDLESAINRDVGIREQSSRIAAEEQRAISLLTKQRNAYQKMLNNGIQLSSEERAEYEKLNAELEKHRASRNQATQAIRQNIKEMEAEEGSIVQMRGRLGELTAEYVRLSAARRDSAEGKELLATLQKQYAELSKLEQAMGNYRRNVGNYASAWNGLGVSVQQVVRELPSMAMGFDMFFLAISNNLPMLTDEIKAATEAYKQAVAQGQKATPVWKQLLTSIVSWQTALIVGVTVLAQYGDEIINWVTSLFKGKEAIDTVAEAQKIYDEAMMQGAKNAQREKVQLDLLYKAATDSARPMEERRKAVDELQRLYPDYLGNMSDEEILAGKAATAYQRLSDELIRTARAKAAMNKITENQEKLLELEPKLAEAQAARERAQAELTAADERARKYTDSHDAITTNAQVLQSYAQQSMNAAQALSEAKEVETDLQNQIDILNRANEQLAGQVTTDDVIEATGGGNTGSGTSGGGGGTYDPYQDNLEARRAYEDALGELIADEWERRRYQTTLQYNREIEDLQHRLDTEKDLTAQAQEDITKQMVLLEQQRNAELAKIEQDRQRQLLELERQGIETRMRGLSENTEQYRTLQNQLSNVELRIALQDNAALPESQQQDPQSISDAANRESAKYNYRFELDRFDEYLEETYDREYNSEVARTAMRLNMEKEKWEKILQLTEQYGSDITGYEVSQVKKTLDGIDKEMKGLGKGWDTKQSVFGNLFDMVFGNPIGNDADGLEKEEAFKSSISESVSFAMEQLGDFADYKKQLADQAVENADREVDAAQSALQAELQARASGYASNVAQARKELELAQKNQRKALQEQQKAQKQQLAIQSVEQASNLVTASAKIWAQLGFPLAIPALAIMWATFAASKIKAMQMTKQSSAYGTETYGEGHVELLQGGSHQSGNDIDLGRKKDGTRRRAEGGEFFAVINKRSSRKYRSVIPDVINSLNNETFAQKYLTAYDGAKGLTVNVAASDGKDLRGMSDDVRHIRRQGERRVYNDGKCTVIVYKNLKRKIY